MQGTVKVNSKSKLQFSRRLNIQNQLVPKGINSSDEKNPTFSQLYQILALYNESIAFATKGSNDLIAAYANKSAVLLRMRKYDECITEIERALKLTESTSLKIKLLCRKAECLTALGSSENRSYLKKAKFMITKLEDSGEIKATLEKLIEKTQLVIDRDKLDIPKENKRKTQALKMIEEAERTDFRKTIRFEYSKIYGRHLVAAQNFNPGEILLIEKPYYRNLEASRVFQYCDHCFYHLWTAVPCDHCSRRLFCSEECKNAAWDEYHEMECFALSNMVVSLKAAWKWHFPLVTSVFCKALKEAGSIEQLLADSKSSSGHKDQSKECFKSNKDFTGYKNIFTLPVGELERIDLDACLSDSIAILIGLAKYTKILGRTYKFSEMRELMRNDTAILVGTLLLQFTLLLGGGFPATNLVDPNKIDSDSAPSTKVTQNSSVTILAAHALYGCLPNIDGVATHGNRFIVCAMRPIKEGDQLVLHSKSFSLLMNSSKTLRQRQHIKIYNCPCECRACTENWDDILWPVGQMENPVKKAELAMKEWKYKGVAQFWREHRLISFDWKNNSHKPSYLDIKILLRAMNLVAKAWELVPMPSYLLLDTMLLLVTVFRAFYDPSEIYAKLPHLRELEIDKNVYPAKVDAFMKQCDDKKIDDPAEIAALLLKIRGNGNSRD